MPAQKKQPLILVSEDYDPHAWTTLEGGESEVEAWLAVAQDLWGVGCFGPCQMESMRQGANGMTVTKQQTVGAIGGAMGGIGPVAADYETYIDVFECDANVLAFNQENGGAVGAKLLKLTAWSPQRPEIKADRYHSLIAYRAFSSSPCFETLGRLIAMATKGPGHLYVDDIYADDPSVAALVAQGIAGPGQQLHIHSHDATVQAVKNAGLELRSSVSATEPLMEAIHKGLAHGQDIAQLLKAVPQPHRKHRMMAFTNELQRAAVLYQALDKGLVTATRSIFYRARQL